jgi:HAD superfamily hydrolase (TIGR01509 family)
MRPTIFFDLGNVLVFFDYQKMFRQIADYCEKPLPEVEAFLLPYLDSYERGTMDSKALHHHLCSFAGKDLAFEKIMHGMANIFEPNLPVIDLVTQLKTEGYPLFLLSNTCHAHFHFIRSHFTFPELFTGYVLSYEVGARKPEKAIYEKALEIAGCQKEDCFYIDDVLDYVEAARSLQIDAELYSNPNTLRQHLFARGMLQAQT